MKVNLVTLTMLILTDQEEKKYRTTSKDQHKHKEGIYLKSMKNEEWHEGRL